MADQTASLSTFRTSRHVLGAVKFSFYKGSVVASGTISTTPTNSALNLAISVGTGTIGDVVYGMRVQIKTSGGALKGLTHVRNAGTISSSNLPIREFSDAKINIVSGDTWEVLNEFPLVDKLVASDVLFEPDYLAYTDEGSNPPPIVGSGGHWAGKVDNGQSYATVNVFGTTSWAVDPDSGGTLTHLWTLPTGVTFNAGSINTDVNPLLRVTAGRYLVKHTVTDSDNSKSNTQYITMVCDDGTGTYAWDVFGASVDGNELGLGAAMSSASITLPYAVSLSDLPDGSLAILWADEEVIGAFTNTYRNWIAARSHILFVGYVRRDTTTADNDMGNVTSIDIVSPMERLREIVSYSKGMDESASPDTWQKVKTLKVFRAMTQIVLFYTSLNRSGFDWVTIDSAVNKDYSALYVQKSNFLDQLIELASAIRSRIVCDRTGRFTTTLHPALADMTTRGAAFTTSSYTDDDVYTGYTLERQQWEPVEYTRIRGFTAGSSNNLPIAAVYPSRSPGMGTDNTNIERCIITDIAEAKAIAGLYGAYYDGVIVNNSTGARTYATTLNATLSGGYDHFDFVLEYMYFDLNVYREDIAAQLCYISKWRVVYDGVGSCEVSITANVATWAGDGAQDDVDSEYIPPPVDDPPVIPIVPIDFPANPRASVQKMALVCVNGLARSTNFQSASPSYDYLAWGSFGTAVTGTVLTWVPNGYEAGSGWLCTTTKIYYINISTRTATLKHTWSATCQSVSADASFSVQNHFCAVAYIQGTGSTACYTTDNSTFTEALINAAYATDGASFGIQNGCYVSSKTAGKVITSVYTTTGSALSGTVVSAGRVSLDYGATWGAITSPTITTGITLAATIHLPYQGNGSESTAYYTRIVSIGSHLTQKAIGASVSDVSPEVSGDDFAPRVARDGICTSVQNAQRVLAVAQTEDVAGTYAVFLSNDAAASWTTIVADGSAYRRCAISGDSASVGWLWGVSDSITQIAISGTSITEFSKTGNLASFSVSDIIAIAGW